MMKEIMPDGELLVTSDDLSKTTGMIRAHAVNYPVFCGPQFNKPSRGLLIVPSV